MTPLGPLLSGPVVLLLRKHQPGPWDPAPSLGYAAMEAPVGTGTGIQQSPLLELWHKGAPPAPDSCLPAPAQVPLREDFSQAQKED